MQERHNSIANTLELGLSCTNPSILNQGPHYFNGLVQERRNSIANTLKLHLSCTKPSISSLLLQTLETTCYPILNKPKPKPKEEPPKDEPKKEEPQQNAENGAQQQPEGEQPQTEQPAEASSQDKADMELDWC